VVIETIWYVGGILFILLGVGVSIALHEVGHLVPAKLFGVKVKKYMVGFGPTVFSRKRGETEYGIKAIPLGGYIAMVGMFPPEKPGKKIRWKAWSRQVAAARAGQLQQFGADEPGRNFYELPVLKRIVIMLGGPVMNLLLGCLFMIAALVGVGPIAPTATVAEVVACVPLALPSGECSASDPVSPAAKAGMRAGDRITAVDGKAGVTFTNLRDRLRPFVGKTVTLSILRDGKPLQLNVAPVSIPRASIDPATGRIIVDSNGNPVLTSQPFIGFAPVYEHQSLSVAGALMASGESVGQTFKLIIDLPQQISKVAVSTFGGGERSTDGPVSILGVTQIAGDMASDSRATWQEKLGSELGILASLNFALFVFNLLPLLPLDGGHVAGGLYEIVKRGWFKLRGKSNPGPVDTALMVPITMAVWMLLIGMSLLFILADFINPIQIGA